MSRRCVLLLATLLAGALWAGPDDDFVEIYQLIQQTDAQRENGKFPEAREGYKRAQGMLQQLKKSYPEWNERVVAYRLRYVAEKITALPDPGAVPAAGNPPLTAATAEAAPESEVLNQFRNLHGEISQLRGEKQKLEAKLREALTAQPAPVDPKELQAAIDRITQLQTTNRFLTEKLETQQAERRHLVERVLVDEAQQALASANQQLTAQVERAVELETLRDRAEAELKRLRAGEVNLLQTENAALKSQVTELASSSDRGQQIANLAERVAKLQSGLDETRQQNEVLLADRTKLERQLEDLKARQSEESLIRLQQMETDLAFARAEGERQSVRATQLEERLRRESGTSVALEQVNRSLSNRVAELTGKVEDLQAAQIQLQAEKEERVELEAQLHAAEQQLAAVRIENIPATATGNTENTATAAESVKAARLQALETEATRLREVLRESRVRQNELLALVAESERSRARWERERQELLQSLASLQKSPSQQQLTRANRSISTLEERVRRLERERDTLVRRLDEATRKSRNELQLARKNRMGTPREEAARFRLERN